MKDPQIGLRVELTEDIQMHKAGERGLIGEKGGYIGVVFDSAPGALTLSHAGTTIFKFVKIIADERQPELQQLSLFGGLE